MSQIISQISSSLDALLPLAVLEAILLLILLGLLFHQYRTRKHLQQRSKRLSLILDAGKDQILELDTRTMSIQGEPDFFKALGLGASSRLDLDSLSGAVHPQEREDLVHACSVLASGQSHGFSRLLRLSRANGRWFWVRMVAKVSSFDRSGQATGATILVTDVHENHIMAEEMRKNFMLLSAQRDLIPDCILSLDKSGHVLDLNKGFHDFFDLAENELRCGDEYLVNHYLWTAFQKSFEPYDLEILRSILQPPQEALPIPSRHKRRTTRLKDGRTLEYYAGDMFQDGNALGVALFFRDLTAQHHTEKNLKLTRFALDHLQAPVDWFDAQGLILYSNELAAQTFGFESPGEMRRLKAWDIYPFLLEENWATFWAELEEHKVLVREFSTPDKKHSYEVFFNHFSDDQKSYSFNYLRDVTQRLRYQKELETAAFYDPVTELPNLRLFSLETDAAIKQRKHGILGLVLVDIDFFKTINDVFDHSIGDELLLAMAKRIGQHLMTGEMACRIAGDEFMLRFHHCRELEELKLRVQTLQQALHEPYLLHGQEFLLRTSMGIAVSPHDGEQWEELYTSADIAMYRAKEDGRATWRFFTQDMKENLMRNHQIGTHLYHALDKNELFLSYQAQVDIKTGAVRGFETLMRWRSQELGMVPPMSFIPVAESNGLIVNLGFWALEEACRQTAQWNAQRSDALVVSVNVSAAQLKTDNFTGKVMDILARTGLPPSQLELEITESMIIENIEHVITMLAQLRSQGIKIAMDDFGTGYSSLGYLQRLPLDKLKIDRSFVDTMLIDPDTRKVIRIIIALGKTLGLHVIAEGVETEEQLKFLEEEGCDLVQGFLYGYPLDADEFAGILEKPELTTSL